MRKLSCGELILMETIMTFDQLAEQIRTVHQSAQTSSVGAINRAMTLRNWLIGCYIVEFEQHGEKRAEYGANLLKKLEERIHERGLNTTLFKLSRKFYLTYPQIGAIVSHQLNVLPSDEKSATPSHLLDANATVTTQHANERFVTPPETLISRLSFSHIREIMTIDDPLERFFYEFECMRCGWSVKELRREIAATTYFRAGMSKNPELLLQRTITGSTDAMLSIKDPFAFEFLGLSAKEAVTESDVEQALMDHLQEFLLEMGKGFCFEARQKRVVIDDEYYFIDLVLYHRILHCNVIIELKDDKFTHEHFGQLNAYVAYYRENEMHPGDNPPIGILLCTQKGPKMVEYALSGMDNQLFVSTYMLQLPDKEQLREFLLKQMEELGG